MNQKRSTNKVLSNYIFLVLMLVALWMPNSYSYILSNLIYSLLRYTQYFAGLIATVMVFITHRQNKIFILNIILSLILIFSTIVNNGNVNKCLNYVAPMLGTVALITYYIGGGREKELLRAMRHVLLIYILINIATYFLFPRGLYITELVTRYDDKQNTFLGNRNTYKYYGLFIILVSYLESRLTDKKTWLSDRNSGIAIALALIMELLGESLTGTVIILFIAIYYIFGDKMLRIRSLNPKVFFYISVGLFVFATVFIAAGRYTAIISYFFSGNITFSHRTAIWLRAETIILQNPIIGIGTQTNKVMFTYLRNIHAHNQFLEIAIRGGLVGTAIYLLIVWTSLKRLSEYRKYEIVSFVTICIFAVMIIDMVECETYSYAILSYFTAIAYCWRYPKEYLESKAQKKIKIVWRKRRG